MVFIEIVTFITKEGIVRITKERLTDANFYF